MFDSNKLKKLTQKFYDRKTVRVAKDLLGKYLVHIYNGVEYIGKIVEVEAYLGAHDLAAHSSKGLTKRTKIMFGPAGYAYVFLVYGIHHCFNVVTEGEGNGSAILIRAIEPIQNIVGRTQGPGLVCKSMHIDLGLNGHNLESNTFYIGSLAELPSFKIIETPRIGIDYAGVWVNKLLRFYIANNEFVSQKK